MTTFGYFTEKKTSNPDIGYLSLLSRSLGQANLHLNKSGFLKFLTHAAAFLFQTKIGNRVLDMSDYDFSIEF